MSHGDWVAERVPAPPERLAVRVRDLMATNPVWEALPAPEALLGAGEALLAAVLAERPGEARQAALDLLAADACITWALEAAADEPRTLGARAQGAMHRLAAEGA